MFARLENGRYYRGFVTEVTNPVDVTTRLDDGSTVRTTTRQSLVLDKLPSNELTISTSVIGLWSKSQLLQSWTNQRKWK